MAEDLATITVAHVALILTRSAPLPNGHPIALNEHQCGFIRFPFRDPPSYGYVLSLKFIGLMHSHTLIELTHSFYLFKWLNNIKV